SIRSLLSASPGTMASPLMASSRRSSRRSALRAALSAPWQAKQFSAKMGRTSRLYWSFFSAARTAELTTESQRTQRENKNRDDRTIRFISGFPFCFFLCVLCDSVVSLVPIRQGSAPVAVAGANVPRHGFARRLAVAGQKRFDDGQMFVGFLGQAVEIVAGFV